MQRRLPQLIFLGASACASTPASVGAVLVQTRDGGRVTVREVPEGLPAARAGIQPGDELLLIDGRDVRVMSPQAIHLALEGVEGSSVRLTLLRTGRIERVTVPRVPLGTAKVP